MWIPAHTGIIKKEEADEAAKESLEQEVETTHKVVKTEWSGWTRKKCLKIDKGPCWNQGVKSVGTLVPRASHDDNNWWYQGLGWAIQI
jgi:hypothetical protein